MSREGIEKAAKVFALMQSTRNELLRDATTYHRRGKMGRVERCDLDKQDLRLAQMIETGSDAMKKTFAEITLMKDTKVKTVGQCTEKVQLRNGRTRRCKLWPSPGQKKCWRHRD